MGKLLNRVLVACSAYAAAEVAFQGWRWSRYSKASQHPEMPDTSGVTTAMERFFSLHGVIDIRAFFSGWFHNVPFEDIHRDNVQDFVTFSLFCCTYEQLTSAQHQQADDFIDHIEDVWGFKFPLGRNPDISPMSHLREPLRVLPVPLVVYLASEACGLAVKAMMRNQGYKRSVSNGFTFWVKAASGGDNGATPAAPLPQATTPHALAAKCVNGDKVVALNSKRPGGDGSRVTCGVVSIEASSGGGQGPLQTLQPRLRPLVFLHGVGWGLFPYLTFVRKLAAAAPRGTPIVVAEAPHISLRLCQGGQTIDELANAVAALLAAHRLQGALMVGHSYGTFAVSRLRQLYPELVQSMALLDPVCLMTCAPHLLSNFIYKPPRVAWRAPGWLDVLEVLRYMCARDLMISAAFCRGFFWHELMLWPEDMKRCAALLVLSGRDTLVPLRLIQAQLAKAGSRARVLLHAGGGHGGFLFDSTFQAHLVNEIKQLLTVPERKAP